MVSTKNTRTYYILIRKLNLEEFMGKEKADMQYKASDFRAMARDALKGKWTTAIVLTILASALGVATATLDVELKFESETGMVVNVLEQWSFTLLQPGGITTILAVMSVVWAIILLIIGGAMTLGYYQFHQNLARGEEAEISTLFVHKDKLWHGFCINFWQLLYIFLWTICFIIPGIVAAYSYSMTHYIANDHPEMTAREAIAASKEMMKGHRWRLFCLEISFIGWGLLAALTLGIGSFVVVPYLETSMAFFYQDLLGKDMRLEENILNENMDV